MGQTTEIAQPFLCLNCGQSLYRQDCYVATSSWKQWDCLNCDFVLMRNIENRKEKIKVRFHFAATKLSRYEKENGGYWLSLKQNGWLLVGKKFVDQ